ncbi:MAG TPA: hypothetical protein VFB66_05500 [Tepidisphaeraceae bacterium]|nr:hypothetical protein [Tepidisphaeraceae bacterium]
MKNKHKPYDRMNAEELAEATKEYDREQVGLRGKPLTKRDREIHRIARRKQMGRPKIGKGTQAVSITIELGLLKKADAIAKRRKVNRSQLITQALEREIERSSKAATPAGPRPRLRRVAAVGRL